MVTIALQLHPDRLAGADPGAGLVLEALARTGRYRSQFETGTSNGGLTAHPGGDRWRWESRLFEGRYDAGPASARPVYGAVDRGAAHGPAPRFGSAYLRLHPAVAERATYCFPDSVHEPDGVTGRDGLGRLLARCDAVAGSMDPLDVYVEAHVHGGVDLADDVAAVVLDPCFRGGPVERAALLLVERGVGALEWHPGFEVGAAALDPAYRGEEIHALAVALAAPHADRLTPDVVGIAARRGLHHPQDLKKVWHLLARFGRSGLEGRPSGD